MFADFLMQNLWLVLAIVVVIGLIVFESTGFGGSGRAVQVTDVAPIINNQQGVVLDIRDKESFAKGHIANARNLPMADLEAKIAQIKKWQKKPIIVACNTGLTAKKAITTLKKHDFQNVYLMTGGMQAWLKEGFPVVTKDSQKEISGKSKKLSRQARAN